MAAWQGRSAQWMSAQRMSAQRMSAGGRTALALVALTLGACSTIEVDQAAGPHPTIGEPTSIQTAPRGAPTAADRTPTSAPTGPQGDLFPDRDDEGDHDDGSEIVTAAGAPTHTLVAHVTVDEITAYAGPASSRAIDTFANPTRHGGPLVLRSLADPGSPLVDSGWIPVMLPVRPNGTIGWVRTADVELTRNPYRIEVDVDDFSLTVYRENEEYFRTTVGIGDGDTPTPYGSFYLTDLVRPANADGVYGPYAYGLSGYSETLSTFNGGQGVIGIHGTNQPDALGTRVSHGCVRVANESIVELVSFLPLGTPVVIDDDPGSVKR